MSLDGYAICMRRNDPNAATLLLQVGWVVFYAIVLWIAARRLRGTIGTGHEV
jgi:hypothetical protein